eukprot:g13170.t1
MTGSKGGPRFCAKHPKEGMIMLGVKSGCKHPGCGTRATYGVAGTKDKEFCRQHAKPGMINLYVKRCSRPGCMTSATYGVEGTKNPEFCSPHAKDGMVSLISNKRGSRTGSACDSSSGRPRKRPRHPGDLPPEPALLKQEMSPAATTPGR